MKTVDFLDEQQKVYLKEFAACPFEHLAARKAQVPIDRVRRWLSDDPDFALVCHEIKEVVVDQIEEKAVDLAKEGSENMIKFILPALRPKTWNPNAQVEEEVIGHRFVDFTGEALHDDSKDNRLPGPEGHERLSGGSAESGD